jgi:hypothetical protein
MLISIETTQTTKQTESKENRKYKNIFNEQGLTD